MKSRLAIWSFILAAIPLGLLFIGWIYMLFTFNITFFNSFTGQIIYYSVVFLEIIAGIMSVISLIIIQKYNLEGKVYAIAALITSVILLIILLTNGSHVRFDGRGLWS